VTRRHPRWGSAAPVDTAKLANPGTPLEEACI
jgi:hypothetical protein